MLKVAQNIQVETYEGCFVITPEGTVHVTLNPIEGWAAAQKKRGHKHGKYLAMTLWTVAPFDRDCKTVLASCRNVLGLYEEMGGRSAEGTVAFHL